MAIKICLGSLVYDSVAQLRFSLDVQICRKMSMAALYGEIQWRPTIPENAKDGQNPMEDSSGLQPFPIK